MIFCQQKSIMQLLFIIFARCSLIRVLYLIILHKILIILSRKQVLMSIINDFCRHMELIGGLFVQFAKNYKIQIYWRNIFQKGLWWDANFKIKKIKFAKDLLNQILPFLVRIYHKSFIKLEIEYKKILLHVICLL